MTFGAELWGPPLIQGVGSLVGGWLGGQGAAKNETKLQKQQRKLIDSLIQSLGGQGKFADLYNTSEEAFQKSFVEPAQSMFRNKIAPGIQQEYIASGQQRGTGLDDQLLRAGVDIDSMLNQYMYQNQQDALNRKQGTINSILGSGSGAANQPSGWQNLASAGAGYLSSPGFSDNLSNLFKNTPQNTGAQQYPGAPQTRKGFEPDWMNYQLGDKRWGQS